MEEIQKQIANIVSELMPQLCALSDEIFDYAEPGYEEYRSSAALTKWLRAHDFEVTIPYAGLDTAFCAVYRHKGGRAAGGRAVGFLGEYDALRGQGHGCAHHMQTPAMIGAAMALRGVLESSDQPFEIHVIGTPSEESLDGGKNEMAAHGGYCALCWAQRSGCGDHAADRAWAHAQSPQGFQPGEQYCAGWGDGSQLRARFCQG